MALSLSLGYLAGSRQLTEQTNVLTAECTSQQRTELLESTISEKITYLPESQQAPRACVSHTQSSSTPPPIRVIFNQLLTSEKYAEAINIYHATWNISQIEAANLKQLFIEHVHELIRRRPGQTTEVDDALDTYLADFYDDIDILLLSAKYKARLGLHEETLDTLQLAKVYAYEKIQQQQVNSAYIAFMDTIDALFSEQKQWRTLISLYTRAEHTDLLTSSGQFRLVELYLLINDIEQARSYAEILATDTIWRDKIASIMPKVIPQKSTKNNADDSFESTIALTQRANQFIINAQLSTTDTPLLIDTGASITTITQTFYESIKRKVNMRYQTTQTFITANGKIKGSIYRVDQFVMGDYIINDVEIAVLDFHSSAESAGLLGMNILSQFRFEIDQQNSQLKLKKLQ
ncbi:MAG: clan AA aspartic protease (TIGR02281 family) [Granulosicoccus sp.]|jgi:clan AA aspartic protease (TIGR02281 family)